MSIHYETLPQATLYPEAFDVPPPAPPLERNLRARRTGVFIRRLAGDTEALDLAELATEPLSVPVPATDVEGGVDMAPVARELVTGQWGLVPPWVKSASDAKLRSPKLVNARSETVTTSNNFRDAWLKGQRCIVPIMAFFEDDWRNVKGSGKPVPTRISRVDGKPMGVAGLWERWTGHGEDEGQTLISYTLLTVNANSHALLHRYQPPGSEKRMPAILNEGAYSAWLNVRPEKAREFMRAYAANWLTANPVETKADKRPMG